MLQQVSRVVYPALPDHPYFPRVQKLLGGQAGGVVSFELTGGAPAAELMFQVCTGPAAMLLLLTAVHLEPVFSARPKADQSCQAMLTQ